jgi:hypothetical protein
MFFVFASYFPKGALVFLESKSVFDELNAGNAHTGTAPSSILPIIYVTRVEENA